MKIKLINLLSALTLIALLFSCQTLEEQGEELYAKGLFEEALVKFEAASRMDPSDAKTSAWVQKTRTKIIDKSLLEVRFLRLGKNPKAATEKLETILRRQENWKVLYTGALMASQEKEVREANDYLIEKIKQAEVSETPSYVKWVEYQFNRSIAAGDCQSYLSSIYPRLKDKAQKKYLQLVNSLDRSSFFASEMAEAYASLWRIPSKPVVLQDKDPSRFSELLIENKLKQKDTRFFRVEGLNKELKRTFQNSLFYYPHSEEKLELKVVGQTSYNRHHHLEPRVAIYREPYTVYEWQEKSHPNNDYRGFNNENLTQDLSKSIANRNYQYNALPIREKVAVTRYRDVSFPYQVLVYHEKYQAHLRGFFKNKPHFSNRLSFSYEPENTTEAHEMYMAAANIYPKKANFLNQNEVVTHTVKGFATQLEKSLRTEWKKLYCSAQAKHDTESVQRCAKISPQDPKVNQWYQRNFGVDYQAFHTLLSYKRT